MLVQTLVEKMVCSLDVILVVQLDLKMAQMMVEMLVV